MRRSAIVLLPLCIAAWAPCAASADVPPRNPQTSKAPRLGHVTLLERGFDAGGEFCRDFKLTSAQAQWFFRRAHFMGADVLYQRLNELPCWVKGNARVGGSTLQWEIRAGGTASLTQPDGSVRLLGCETCDAVLGGSAARKP